VESTLLAREGSPLFQRARKAGLRVEALGWARVWTLARRHDLVHAHDARTHTMALAAGGAPLIVARRVAFPIRSPWKYRRAAKFVAVSECVKGVLASGGVPADRIAVVYDGVPLLESAQTGGMRYTLAKGAALALEAARLAGVELKVSAAPEDDLVNASLLVYVSDCEGLGSAALLAMSAGVPVIASRAGGLPEVVRDGETGLLVENEAAAIAQTIRRLVDDPALARRMGEAGRHRVIANFTVEHMVRRTMEVYGQVLA
jgi:hypothetical protein